ncbi:hypothetical protein BDV12DRAFT_184216 [Aspergillus spectabilis]
MLTDKYRFDLGAKSQPPVNIDDLLFNTYYLMAVTKLSTLRKMMTSTSAGPGIPCLHYTKRNDNIGLCIIQDILEYAFLDNTFATHHLSTPIYFKKRVHDTPIFCRPGHEVATSKSAGSKTPGSLCKYRKGAASKLRHLDEHLQNIIIGHKRSVDTQSTFISVPRDLSNQQKEELEKDSELSELKRKRDCFWADLITHHHQSHKARSTVLFKEFTKAKNEVRAKRKKLHKTTNEAQHNDFFSSIGNHIIEQNYQGELVCFKPDTFHVVLEKIALVDLEFKNRDADQINDAELVEDYICPLEMCLAPHRLDVSRILQKRIRFDKPSADTLVEMTIPLQSETVLGSQAAHGIIKEAGLLELRRDMLEGHEAFRKIVRFDRDCPDGKELEVPWAPCILSLILNY